MNEKKVTRNFRTKEEIQGHIDAYRKLYGSDNLDNVHEYSKVYGIASGTMRNWLVRNNHTDHYDRPKLVSQSGPTGRRKNMHSAKEIKAIITEFKRSGLSLRKFASERGVPESTLHGWLKRRKLDSASKKARKAVTPIKRAKVVVERKKKYIRKPRTTLTDLIAETKPPSVEQETHAHPLEAYVGSGTKERRLKLALHKMMQLVQELLDS